MSSQKQCHRIRRQFSEVETLEYCVKNLQEQAYRLAKENELLAAKVECYESRPPIWKLFSYLKWRKKKWKN